MAFKSIPSPIKLVGNSQVDFMVISPSDLQNAFGEIEKLCTEASANFPGMFMNIKQSLYNGASVAVATICNQTIGYTFINPGSGFPDFKYTQRVPGLKIALQKAAKASAIYPIGPAVRPAGLHP